MKRIIIILLVLGVAFDSSGQFRKRKNPTKSSSKGNLNYANPSVYTIAGIDVEGLSILDKNAILSLTGLKVGDEIKVPGDAITGAIRKLWKHGLVGDVSIQAERIEGTDIYLLITLAERPRLTNYYFQGISKGRQTSLKEDLDLIKGKIVNDAMVRNTELAVRKHFLKKGFLHTQVDIFKERDSLNGEGIQLRVKVDLKSKVRINSISFIGNNEIPDSKLRKKMKKTHQRPGIFLHRILLRKIFKDPKSLLQKGDSVSYEEAMEFVKDKVRINPFVSSKFIPSDFENDKKSVIEFYNSKGYRDAEIVSDTIYNFDKESINLFIYLNEGPKYYFRDIFWKGNYVYNDNILNAIMGIQKGDVYNKELIQRKITFNPKGPDITGLYMDDGYLFFNIRPVEVAVEGDSIDVEMRIVEGEQATLKNISISGNTRTRDHVIRRELRTVPGQKFKRSDIIRTQQSLSQLGYFNPETLNPNMMPNPAEGTVDIDWQVEEQSNDQIQLSGGWGGYYGFVGTLGLTFNNFSLRNIPNLKSWSPLPGGDGQRLSMSIQASGKFFQSYGFSFTEPWLGGRKPQSLSISYTGSISRQINSIYSYSPTSPGISDETPKFVTHNISLGLGKLLEWPDNYFTLTSALSYKKYVLANYPLYLFGFSNGKANTITLDLGISRRSTGDPKYPTEGSEISLNVSLTPPFSLWRDINYDVNTDDDSVLQALNQEKYQWIEYHKWMFDAKFYLPLDKNKKLVLEAKAHMGFIGSYSKQYGYGPFERFTLGGSGLAGGFNSFVLGQDVIGLRGYDDNRVTPPYYGNGSGGTEISGGIVYNKFGLELRYPVTTGNAATIYGFVFTEGGNNWNNYEDFNPFNLYKSAGAGVRLFMPAFGLIGLNWAYGFDKLPFDQKISGSQFHFTIGQQIR